MNINPYLLELPPYVAAYIREEEETHAVSNKTAAAFAFDFQTFFDYLVQFRSPRYPSPKEVPLADFLALKEADLSQYMDYLVETKKLASNTVLRKVSTLHRFFLYLHKKGLTDACPTVFLQKPQSRRKKDVLTEKQILTLLSGIRSNSKILVKTENGREILPISRRARLKREKCIPRNLAIITLFLETGITIQEMASLNIADFDYDKKSIHVEGRTDVNDLPLDEASADAVHFYLYGEGVPRWFYEKYPGNTRLYTFCRTYMDDENIRNLAVKEFGRSDDLFLDDIEECARHWRRAGREAMNPKDPDALFLSNRGTRLSVRSIQNLVADLTETYLGVRCTPHMLRITKEAELLAENPAEAYLYMNKKTLKPGWFDYAFRE
ncbi:MAG: hypothetical protein VZR02_01810 [Lachnospiraceae bacterium]|nr:hypothetical protein [Lachnospiraceae bacterium]